MELFLQLTGLVFWVFVLGVIGLGIICIAGYAAQCFIISARCLYRSHKFSGPFFNGLIPLTGWVLRVGTSGLLQNGERVPKYPWQQFSEEEND